MDKNSLSVCGEGRNYALDLLRILSMFMIVMLHSGSHGKTLCICEGLNHYTIWFHFVEALTICSVNVFILISGYFLCTQNFRPSRVIKLYFAVVFYSVMWLIITTYVNQRTLSNTDIFKVLLPISNKQYWFISCYVGLCFISPILNEMIRNLSQIQHIGAIIILVGVFSLWPDLILNSNPLGIAPKGYSLVWFVVLYFIASYFRIYPIRIKPIKALCCYLLAVTLLVLIWVFVVKVSSTTNFEKEIDDGFTFYYYRYNSLIVLVAAVSLWNVFLNLKVQNIFLQRIILFAAPLMMGVYLIHDNKAAREFVWQGISGLEPTVATPFYVIGYVCIIFLNCLLIEKIRFSLFSIINKRNWYKSIIKKIDSIPFHLNSFIAKKVLSIK